MLLPIRKGPKLAIAYARSHQQLQCLAKDPGQVPGISGPPPPTSNSVRGPRPRCRRTENTTPNGSKARRICPGDSGHGRPPLHPEIVDCPPADEAADTSFATDQPSKARAERHWVADIAALAISGRALKNARGDTPNREDTRLRSRPRRAGSGEPARHWSRFGRP